VNEQTATKSAGARKCSCWKTVQQIAGEHDCKNRIPKIPQAVVYLTLAQTTQPLSIYYAANRLSKQRRPKKIFSGFNEALHESSEIRRRTGIIVKENLRMTRQKIA
jgi:hypothetical protein